MVHEVAVHLIEDVVATEKEITRVLHSLGDDFAFFVEFKGIVDVATIQSELSAVAHDIASDKGVFYDVVDLTDSVRLAWADVVIDACFSLSLFILDGMCDFGMEIADLVEVTFHLVG